MRRWFMVWALLAATSPAYAGDAQEVFMQQVQNFWGASVTEDDLHIIKGALNSDDADDAVGWRVRGNAPDTLRLEMIAVVNSADHGVQTANISIPMGGDGLCAQRDSDITVNLEPWSDTDKVEHGLRQVGPNAVHIDDGKCDAIRLFWPENTPHATVDMRMLRN